MPQALAWYIGTTGNTVSRERARRVRLQRQQGVQQFERCE
jgi:hypothetical protein